MSENINDAKQLLADSSLVTKRQLNQLQDQAPEIIYTEETALLPDNVRRDPTPSYNSFHSSQSKLNVANESISECHQLDLDLVRIEPPMRSIVYLLVLTLVIGGLQVSASLQMSYGSPFLLSLGLSKSLLSLVWIAGPLSGAIGQHIFGALSDAARWKVGRRRPFIVGGAIATILSLNGLAWSKEIAFLFTKALFSRGDDNFYLIQLHSHLQNDSLNSKALPVAIFLIYLLSFSISCIQSAARAFIVDNVATNQQQIAMAWAARMIGLGNLIGYFLGSIDLPKFISKVLGSNNKTPMRLSQFKMLCLIASVILIITVAISCTFVKERDPNLDLGIRAKDMKAKLITLRAVGQGQQQRLHEPNQNRGKIRKFVVRACRQWTRSVSIVWSRTIYAISHLSPQTRLVCFIEFFAWMGYFPILFFTSVYIASLYLLEELGGGSFASFYYSHVTTEPKKHIDLKELQEAATRCGAMGLLTFSCVSLGATFLLPYIIRSSYVSKKEVDKKLEIHRRLQPSNSLEHFDERRNVSLDSEVDVAPSADPLTAFDDAIEAVSHIDSNNNGNAISLVSKTVMFTRVLFQQLYSMGVYYIPLFVTSFITYLQIPGLTISLLWTLGHVIFAAGMVSTYWIQTSRAGTLLVGILGIPWALASWAPFSIIAEESARVRGKRARDTLIDESKILSRSSATNEIEQEDNQPLKLVNQNKRYHHYEYDSGVIFAVQNGFVALPQVLSSLMASILFKVLDTPTEDQGPGPSALNNNATTSAYSIVCSPSLHLGRADSAATRGALLQSAKDTISTLSWGFRIGGLVTFAAVFLSLQIKNPDDVDLQDEEEVRVPQDEGQPVAEAATAELGLDAGLE